MDSTSPETPITLQASQSTIQPPVQPTTPAKSKKTIFTSLVILVVLISLGAAGFFAYKYVQLRNQIPAVTPTPTPFSTPTPDPTADLSRDEVLRDWKTYSNTVFSFKYPAVWDTFMVGEDPGKALMVAPKEKVDKVRQMTGGFGGGIFLTLTISMKSTPPDWKTEESWNVTNEPIVVDGITGTKYTVNVVQSLPGLSEGDRITSVVLKKDATYIQIELLDKTYDTIYSQILSTFRFVSQTNPTTGQFCGGIAGKICPEGYTCRLDGNYPDAGGSCIQTTKTKTGYTCPVNGWVDCMPGTSPKPECSTAAMDWYQANCPDFKGGAL
jgi:hypothetical protein